MILVPARAAAAEGSIRHWLAGMAAVEHAARVKHYPARIEAGTLARDDAAADIAAWDAIARLLAAGEVETGLGWAELELAASRALIQRCEAAEAEPGNRRLIERRDAVEAIHERIAWTRAYFTGPAGPAAARAAA